MVNPSVFEVVSSHLNVVKVTGNKIYCVCPKSGCEDKTGHMVVYADTKWTKCFHCGRSTSLRNLLRSIGVTSPGIGNPPKAFLAKKNGKVKLPASVVPLWKKPKRRFAEEAYDYLINTRKISHELAKQYHLLYCFEGKYAGRIIAPVLNREGEIVYFLARAVSTSGHKGKYKNPPMPSTGLFYGMDRVRPGGTVFLVEGMFDKIRGGDQFLASMGKRISLTPEHVEFLLELNPELVVVFFDADAHLEAYRLATELEVVLNTAVLPLDYGDPDTRWEEIKDKWESLLVTEGFRKRYFQLKAEGVRNEKEPTGND